MYIDIRGYITERKSFDEGQREPWPHIYLDTPLSRNARVHNVPVVSLTVLDIPHLGDFPELVYRTSMSTTC